MKVFWLIVFGGVWTASVQEAQAVVSEPSVAGYRSIQEALKANPGRKLYLPAGDYEISEKIQIHWDNSGLFGPGRVVQTNPEMPILEIERATGVEIRDLTLTRPMGNTDTKASAVLAIDCRDLVLENLRVLDNRTQSAAITLRACIGVQVCRCRILNYMRIAIDDRTPNPDLGYAFRCIDGTGIVVKHGSRSVLIEGNRIVEEHLLPTPEVKEKYNLGRFVKKNPRRGSLIGQKAWEEEYVDNWHQGSAILITSPETTAHVQLLGNYIENAAQGIDIHADHITVANNIVHDSFMGMKAMHGSRNVLIVGNQFSKNDLWSIGLMPGTASHAAATGSAGKPAEPNVDGGSIIANNIITDFGYGKSHWIWGGAGHDCCPFRFDTGQKPDNPPLADVIVQGNLVYDTGRDAAPRAVPRYKYAVYVSTKPGGPKGLHFSGNLFHPGTAGVANVELKP
jgi:hypothetical protein